MWTLTFNEDVTKNDLIEPTRKCLTSPKPSFSNEEFWQLFIVGKKKAKILYLLNGNEDAEWWHGDFKYKNKPRRIQMLIRSVTSCQHRTWSEIIFVLQFVNEQKKHQQPVPILWRNDASFRHHRSMFHVKLELIQLGFFFFKKFN